MKQPDETLDDWVRQALGQLPDTSPPGTDFNSDRLWQQLRPTLQKPANSQRTRRIGWVAAASVLGVALVWLRLYELPVRQQQATRQVLPVHRNNGSSEPEKPVAVSKAEAGAAPTYTASASRPAVPSHRATVLTKPVSPAPEPEQLESAPAEPVDVAEVNSVKEQMLTTASTAVVPPRPKQRFQVVHLNELQAEDNIQPSRHRTDRFVRIGPGPGEQPAPGAYAPTIALPLTLKSN